MAETHYGHFVKREPISGRLRVVAGEHRNPMARMQDVKRQMEPLGVIQRGDRSGTSWERRKAALKRGLNIQSIAAIEPSHEIDQPVIEESDALAESFDNLTDELQVMIDEGDLNDDEALEIFKAFHEWDTGSQNVF